MSNRKLSDEEVQPLVLEGIRSMTREEWQARIDATKDAFDRQEAAERAYARNGSLQRSPKKAKESKESRKSPPTTAGIIVSV
jgi:hypothetical protein